jgi:DNA gyrase subunit A
VISLAILREFDATSEERSAYLKMSRAMAGETAEDSEPDEAEAPAAPSALAPERYTEMSAAEQFILTISENGFGKRTSSFEYRLTGRGGKGIVAMAVNARNGKLVASFPVEHGDEVMLVTDGGQLIRCPVEGIRIAGRGTQGVIVFDTADEERVVSVERISEPDGEEDGGE